MEPRKEASLAEYTRKEVMLVLANGDQRVLRTLTREEIVIVLENELRYMAASQIEDDAPEVVHQTIEQNLDRWVQLYLDRPPYGAVSLTDPVTVRTRLGLEGEG